MTIQEALETQAVTLLQNPSQRAVNVLHALKTLATWLYIAQVRRDAQIKGPSVPKGVLNGH